MVCHSTKCRSGKIRFFGSSNGGYLASITQAKDSDLFAAGVDIQCIHDRMANGINIIINPVSPFSPSYWEQQYCWPWGWSFGVKKPSERRNRKSIISFGFGKPPTREKKRALNKQGKTEASKIIFSPQKTTWYSRTYLSLLFKTKIDPRPPP